MIRYGVVRRAQQSRPAPSNIFVWRSYGSGGAAPATHKRLYRNWLFYGGKYRNVIVWQSAGSGGAPPVIQTTTAHYQPILTFGRMFGGR